MVEQNPRQSITEMSPALGVGIATVSRNLLKIGKLKKLDKWVPHELNENQKNRRGPILLHDNAKPHVARMTLQKLTDLDTRLPHPPHSPYLSLTNYHFLKHLNSFSSDKTFRSKPEVESAFKDFLASKPISFNQRGINNPLDRWQRCIEVHGSYFD
ncbi:histone-lysine N-methyltransferase SETMAR-like [Octopus sinensis]|uniref:Histone-lysine N-methyltransferase SETMAR-like n=1 Tax=Octopus sinensis TaxID=2607531 RepID=A0A6P7SGK8_9MOLL|nr:histone-lysine N-methyltransferase SETMAR-like [Octopus sinensis]